MTEDEAFREAYRQQAKLIEDSHEVRAELNAVRNAWEAEHSVGGKEPPPALTCMLLALKYIRDLKHDMQTGFKTLQAERDLARAELAKAHALAATP